MARRTKLAPAPPGKEAAAGALSKGAQEDFEYFAKIPLPREIRLKLDERQLAAVYFYLADPDKGRACLRAGYSQKTGRQTSSKTFAGEGIRSALAYLTDAIVAEETLGREWQRRKLRQLIDAASEAQPVLDRQGKPTGRYQADWAAAARCLEILAKIDGHLGQQVTVTHQGEITHLLRAVADRGKPALEDRRAVVPSKRAPVTIEQRKEGENET